MPKATATPKITFLQALTSARREEVHLPGWPEPVYVRELTLRERDKLRPCNEDADEMLLRSLILSIEDRDGKRLLEDDDYEALKGGLTTTALNKLAAALNRVNGFTTEAQEEALKN